MLGAATVGCPEAYALAVSGVGDSELAQRVRSAVATIAAARANDFAADFARTLAARRHGGWLHRHPPTSPAGTSCSARFAAWLSPCRRVRLLTSTLLCACRVTRGCPCRDGVGALSWLWCTLRDQDRQALWLLHIAGRVPLPAAVVRGVPAQMVAVVEPAESRALYSRAWGRDGGDGHRSEVDSALPDMPCIVLPQRCHSCGGALDRDPLCATGYRLHASW